MYYSVRRPVTRTLPLDQVREDSTALRNFFHGHEDYVCIRKIPKEDSGRFFYARPMDSYPGDRSGRDLFDLATRLKQDRWQQGGFISAAIHFAERLGRPVEKSDDGILIGPRMPDIS